MAVAGCAPEEMGIGPVFAIPKLLEREGLAVDDIGLWELNEAFASRCSTAVTVLASIAIGSMSTAARSRSGTPSA